MGQNPRGPDYGVFNFVELFSQALFTAPLESLVGDAREDFPAKFQHKVSRPHAAVDAPAPARVIGRVKSDRIPA